jgi:hypothetical protein
MVAQPMYRSAVTTSWQCRLCGCIVATAVVLTLTGEPASAADVAATAVNRACQVRFESWPHVAPPADDRLSSEHQGHTEVRSRITRLSVASISITGTPSAQVAPPAWFPDALINWLNAP